MNKLKNIRSLLCDAAHMSQEKCTAFYKTGVGEYAEHDKFIGVNVPTIRKIATEFLHLTCKEIQNLIESPFNEERLVALFILIHWHRGADGAAKEKLYLFYMRNLKWVNNWNLVDASAHWIIGAHLLKADKSILLTLAKSDVMWERRISIVSTWYFIRHSDLEWTFTISEMLLNDQHDLIHKAVGWMLREAGKQDPDRLIAFLDQHACRMPRTMLRYSIEKFPEHQRKSYLMRS